MRNSIFNIICYIPQRTNTETSSFLCKQEALIYSFVIIPGSYRVQSHSATLLAGHAYRTLYTRESGTWIAAQHKTRHIHQKGSPSNGRRK